jgi:hypothetical protein
MCVPYGIIELGLEELVKTVDRDIYPEDQYPYGQWSYQAYYEQSFEEASAFFDADIPALLRASRVRGQPSSGKEVSPLAHVLKDGGWLGGGEKPDPKFRHIPLEMTVYESEESFQEFVAAMEKTGFWPGDAWYSNHAANRKYTLEKRKNDGNIEFPVLFVSPPFLLLAMRFITDLDYFTRSTPLTTPCVLRWRTQRLWPTCAASARTSRKPRLMPRTLWLRRSRLRSTLSLPSGWWKRSRASGLRSGPVNPFCECVAAD